MTSPLALRWSMRARLRASLIHLAASGLVAGATAALVFAFWYPMPYREVSGGRDLFLLVVTVDIVLGPLITLAVFNPGKPRAELVRDLGVVVLLQVAALAYGLHTVALARPAVVALEGNRLRVVRPIDLEQADFAKAPAELRSLSWSGPLLVAARRPNEAEKADAMQRGFAGEDIGMRPEFWLPQAQTDAAYAGAAIPIDRLRTLNAKRTAEVDAAIAAAVGGAGQAAAALGYLPILARRTDWSALVDRGSGRIVGYVPFDGF